MVTLGVLTAQLVPDSSLETLLAKFGGTRQESSGFCVVVDDPSFHVEIDSYPASREMTASEMDEAEIKLGGCPPTTLVAIHYNSAQRSKAVAVEIAESVLDNWGGYIEQ